MHSNTLKWMMVAGLSALLLCSGASCPSEARDYLDDLDAPQTQPADTADDELTVRFVNQTEYALDVEFYVATTLPADISLYAVGDALFVSENQVISGIGLAGRGLIPSQESDLITLTCADTAALGTLGGLLLGSEGEEIGAGDQRFAARDLDFTCGDVITFLYKPKDGGGFDTVIVVE